MHIQQKLSLPLQISSKPHTNAHTLLLKLWVDVVQVPLKGFALELLAEFHSALNTGETHKNTQTNPKTESQIKTKEETLTQILNTLFIATQTGRSRHKIAKDLKKTDK